MEVALGYFEEDDDDQFDTNMNKPPASGIEYLKRVQYETCQHPEVVIVPYPSSPYDSDVKLKSQPVKEKVIPEDNYCLPDETAQAKSAADFAYLRQTFIRFKSKHKHKLESNGKIPSTNDIDSWCEFCFGNNFLDSSNDTNIEKEDMNSSFECGNPPLLGLLSQISQPLAIRLLEYHLKWFNKKGFTMQQGRWLFGLLLCIDKPTPPDALSCLRNISRKFSQLRVKAASNHNKEVLYQLYLFIIIVSKYFGQADLSLS